MTASSPTAGELRAAFDAPSPYTVGLEEELMLLDPETLDLAPCASQVMELLPDEGRFRLELPASQLEIRLAPEPSVAAAAEALGAARRALALATEGLVRPAAAGAHPFAATRGELNRGERYDRILEEYGAAAQSQLICALQVHVAVRGADRALAVYNALRSLLPEIAALAANAPYHGGRDTGMASIRPKVAEQLPRQGVPPPLRSWEEYAGALGWGASAGTVREPRFWWWELRPHPGYGTLELRVPDAQSTVGQAAAVAAVCQSLAARLAERYDAGEPLAVAPTWRIEENRWSAARHGLDGELADMGTGERRPTQERLAQLLEELEPTAARLGCEDEVAGAGDLLRFNGASRQRAAAAEHGLRGLAEWIADQYLHAEPLRSGKFETGRRG